MKIKTHQSKLAVAVTQLALVGSMIAPASYGADLLEELVVTAKKREENLQDVAVSVSAFSADTIRDIGLTNSNDLGRLIPGVEIRAVSGNEMAKTYIRGVGSVDFNANASPTLGVYLDEVYLFSQFQHTTQIFDLQRIEVLRGPQGTLYGRNVTAGAINYVTAKPQQEFSGYVRGSYGNYNSSNVEFAVTGGITDTLAGRIAGVYSYSDGWMESRAPTAATPNSIKDDNINGDDTYSLRASLSWTPTDELEVYFNVHGHQSYADAFNYQHIGVVDPNTFVNNCDYRSRSDCIDFFGYLDPDGYGEEGDQTEGDFDLIEEADNESLGTVLTINWQLEGMTLTSVTGYEKYKRATFGDSDASPNALSHNFFGIDTDGWSQELRLTSDTDGSLDWIVGLYYAEEELTANNTYIFFAPGNTVQYVEQENSAYAIFGNVGYQLNDQIKLTAGLRYTKDKVDDFYHIGTRYVDAAQTTVNAFAPADFDGSTASPDFDDVGWKVGIDYTPNDSWLWYATVTDGYKSGGVGYGFGEEEEVNIFKPEELRAYEVGFKGEFWDGKARLNFSAYFYDYENAHVFDTAAGPFGEVLRISNAPESENYGFEAELITNPIEGLSLFFALSHVKTEFNEFVRPSTGQDLKGNDNVYAPEWKFTGVASYEWPVNLGTEGIMAASINWSWTDEVWHTVENNPLLTADEHWIAGARLSFTTQDDKFEVALWSRNLTDESYRVTSFDLHGAGWITAVPNPPRTFGVEAIYNW